MKKVLGVFLLSILAPSISFALSEAPREGMFVGSWSSGNKEIFGTSYESYDSKNSYSDNSATAPLSKVWFTGAKGILTEVFWPTLDRPQVRDSQFMVSDGKSFLWKENDSLEYRIEWIENGVPAYKSTLQDPRGRFRIERLTYTDPDRNAVIVKVKIVRAVSGLKFYYLHNPSVANSPLHDTGFVDGSGLYAFQGNEAQALLFSLPLLKTSAGFEGTNDGYQDLVSDYVMDANFTWAKNGNVVLTAQLGVPEGPGSTEFTMALGFASQIQGAQSISRDALTNADAALRNYVQGWKEYLASLVDLGEFSLDSGFLFRRSVALMKAKEDKTRAGAFVAAPLTPWGQHSQDTTSYDNEKGQVAGYHLVWPRDLYQMASSFLLLGDSSSGVASLNYLKTIQLGPKDGEWIFGFRRHPRDGSYMQNTWIDGSSYWSSLQLDETSFPVLLAYRLWKAKAIDMGRYWDMTHRAADFIYAMGPWTAQERWEENMGASPSTIASAIAALWSASEMAQAVGDEERARRYKERAEHWAFRSGDNVDTWTFTSTGGLGNGKYYVRIKGASRVDQSWNPNDEETYQISNPGGQRVREKDVIDGGFLQLVRFGVRSAWDYHVNETLHEYDHYIRVDTHRGPGFYRYLGDRYNYDDDSGQNTAGMLWPLLSGERGVFEFEKVTERGGTLALAEEALFPYLSAMERFATPTGMLPEQVWSGGAYEGRPTGAATPLGWAHAEYIKLLALRKYGSNLESIESLKKHALYLQILKTH